MPILNSDIEQIIVPSTKGGLFLCNGGNANILINGKEFKFSRGTLCLISPFLFIEIVSSSADFKIEMICDDIDIFHPVSVYVFYAIPEDNLFKKPCIQLDKKQIEEFMFFVDKIKSKQSLLNCQSKEDDATMLRHNIVLLEQTAAIEFISLYLYGRSRSPRKMTTNEMIVFNFIDSLNRNYAAHRDVDWYAEQANLTTNYFSKIVRLHIGYTPNVMIRHIIVAYAKIMLAQRDLSIKEIATRLNFRDQFAFSRYFKSCAGMSPMEYRKTL